MNILKLIDYLVAIRLAVSHNTADVLRWIDSSTLEISHINRAQVKNSMNCELNYVCSSIDRNGSRQVVISV